MLYNTEWDKPKPTTKYPRFVRWLARQPVDKSYEYCNSCNCGYAQYLRSYGVFAVVGPTSWYGLWLGLVPCFGLVPVKINHALMRHPYTFGALRQRLNG